MTGIDTAAVSGGKEAATGTRVALRPRRRRGFVGAARRADHLRRPPATGPGPAPRPGASARPGCGDRDVGVAAVPERPRHGLGRQLRDHREHDPGVAGGEHRPAVHDAQTRALVAASSAAARASAVPGRAGPRCRPAGRAPAAPRARTGRSAPAGSARRARLRRGRAPRGRGSSGPPRRHPPGRERRRSASSGPAGRSRAGGRTRRRRSAPERRNPAVGRSDHRPWPAGYRSRPAARWPVRFRCRCRRISGSGVRCSAALARDCRHTPEHDGGARVPRLRRGRTSERPRLRSPRSVPPSWIATEALRFWRRSGAMRRHGSTPSRSGSSAKDCSSSCSDSRERWDLTRDGNSRYALHAHQDREVPHGVLDPRPRAADPRRPAPRSRRRGLVLRGR